MADSGLVCAHCVSHGNSAIQAHFACYLLLTLAMTLIVAVLVTSLLGSVHCAAMCGGFACIYAGPAGNRQVGAKPHVTYNLGRLVSYLALGALAGALGHGVERVGSVAGIGRLAAIIGGVLMVVWGGGTLLAALGVRMPQRGVPRALQAALTSLLVKFRNRSPAVRGAVTGLLTTLLPCGWLYVFVATAGGTAHVFDAMAVMFVFWLGTLPMMVTIGIGAQRLFGTFQRRLPLVGAAMAVVLGLLSMAGRLTARPMLHSEHAVEVVHVDR